MSPAFFRLLDNPRYAEIADAVLLPTCGSYWVNTGQAMLIGPGEPAQMLHRDCLNWVQFCAPRWPDCPEITVSAMIALDEVTEELGATRVIPGSHLWEDFTDFGDQSQTVPAELSSGDALVYSGKVVHGAGANNSDELRYGLHVSFVVGWLRPEEASPLMVDRACAAELPRRARQLLGWSSYHSDGGGRTWLVDFEDADRLFA